MRIKVSVTTDPLSKYGFWYVIDNSDNKTNTILDLQRNLNNILHLSKNAQRLKLSLDNFALLPNSPINDLIRDGDLITVQYAGKKDSTSPSLIDKVKNEKSKRSSSTSKRSKSTTSDSTTKSKKRKKHNEDKEQDIKPKRQKKTEKASKTDTSKSTPTSSSTTTALKTDTSKPTPPSAATTAPVSKSKKRNVRRTLARIARREQKQREQTSVPLCTTVEATSTTSDKTPTKQQPVEPRHLVKKNKNKAKHFLKQMDKSTRTHVVYDDEADGGGIQPVDGTKEPSEQWGDGQQQTYVNANILGGAFITDSESQQNGKKKRGNYQQNYLNRQYPVEKKDPVFYAVDEVDNKSSSDDSSDNGDDSSDNGDDSSDNGDDSSDNGDDSSDSSSDDSSDDSSDEDSSKADDTVKETTSKGDKVESSQVVEKVDYEKCPTILFNGPQSPAIGDHLVIKILQMSESYTPEISDWKVMSFKLENEQCH
ncbi:hypothetical protein BC941DRAFT_413715 [Chlamydoabsidia padenii]|nr:hypothetical protein BC941DRAFT_413715 [Chlamydoabsidia padenii]